MASPNDPIFLHLRTVALSHIPSDRGSLAAASWTPLKWIGQSNGHDWGYGQAYIEGMLAKSTYIHIYIYIYINQTNKTCKEPWTTHLWSARVRTSCSAVLQSWILSWSSKQAPRSRAFLRKSWMLGRSSAIKFQRWHFGEIHLQLQYLALCLKYPAISLTSICMICLSIPGTSFSHQRPCSVWFWLSKKFGMLCGKQPWSPTSEHLESFGHLWFPVLLVSEATLAIRTPVRLHQSRFHVKHLDLINTTWRELNMRHGQYLRSFRSGWMNHLSSPILGMKEAINSVTWHGACPT